MACKVDENIAPDGSFSGWPASSQWACADAAKGVLLSPVSLLLHLWVYFYQRDIAKEI